MIELEISPKRGYPLHELGTQHVMSDDVECGLRIHQVLTKNKIHLIIRQTNMIYT